MKRSACAALIVAIVSTTGLVRARIAPTTRCAAAKLAAANRKTAAELRCHQTALLHGRAVDAACIAFASAHFVKAFARAEHKGSCATTGDAAAVEAEVDAYVAELTATLPPGGTTSTTTGTGITTTSIATSTTTTSTIACGSNGLSCGGFCPGLGQCHMDPMLLFCTCN